MIEVVRTGPLTTVQDLGRPGYAHLGVPRSGALDAPALRRANALVGNPPAAAGLETTLLGCALRFTHGARVAITGATAEVRMDGSSVTATCLDVPAGAVLEIGRAVRGVRSYVAVAGGVTVEPVLGSRSTDTLSGLGPAPLRKGDTLPVGPSPDGPGPSPDEPARQSDGPDAQSGGPDAQWGGPDLLRGGPGAPSSGPEPAGELELGVRLGPRDDWFAAGELFRHAYTISPVSNRVGARLSGPALTRARDGELPSEGVVLGAIQVPAGGEPLIFLADHPTTGGYPVIGVVDDVAPLAQARPGTTVRFRELD